MRFGDWLNEMVARRRRPDQDGFTLIELLVVIIILGILAAVVVFAVGGVGDKGASAAAKQDVRTLRTAEEASLAQYGSYGTEAELVTRGLLSEQSQKHDIVLIGDAGPSQTYRITSPPAFAATQAGDGSVPVGGTIRVANTPPSGGTPAPVGGGNFVNPAVTSGGGVHPNVEPMFNGLLRWAENNTVQPDLAQSYTISPDQKTATFNLRNGMTWHNGDPITPADVKFTFEQALNKFHGRTAASIGPALGVTGSGSAASTPVGAITTSGNSVTFNFAYSYAPLLRQMNVTEAPIIPESVYGACAYAPYPGGAGTINTATCPANNPGSGDFPAQTMVGSGPFRLKNRDLTAHTVTFVKRTGYHLPGLPLADELKLIPTVNAADALIANSIDVGNPPNNRVLPVVGTMTADITPANGYSLFQPPRGAGGGNCILTQAFNLWKRGDTPAIINAKAPNAAYEHPIFGDPTSIPANPGAGRPNAMPRGQVVRTALAMATNRQQLFDDNQFGKGRLATSPFHSAVAGYVNTGLPAYDTAKAAQWLTDAGWLDNPGGTPFRESDHAFGTVSIGSLLAFEMIAGSGTTPGSQQVYGNQMATQWAASPVLANMTVTGQSNGDISGLRFADRQFDIISVSYCNGDEPVIGARRQLYAATAPGALAGTQISNTGFTNASGYRTTTMDAAWDAAAQGNGGAYATVQAEAAAAVPHVWLDESLGSRAWKTAKCSGFNNYNTGLFMETAGCIT